MQELKPGHAIQLDVIGDSEVSWKNYCYMSRKVDCIPVLHYRSPKKVIRNILSAAQYIALEALVPLSRQPREIDHWLSYLFSEFPEIRSKKLHTLGMLNQKILKKYPIHSADSTTWLFKARCGYVAQFANGYCRWKPGEQIGSKADDL